MKLNIEKMQSGGSFGSPAVLFTPVTRPAPTVGPAHPRSGGDSSSGSKKDDKKDDDTFISKEISKLLYEHGLPSDVGQFLLTADKLHKSMQRTDLFGNTVASTSNDYYIALINGASKVKFNKEQYDKTMEQLQSKSALGSMAITNRGTIIVQNEEGKLTEVTPQQLQTGTYGAVFNQDLMTLRANNPAFANNQSLLEIGNAATSMQEIQKNITAMITQIGTSTKTEGYTNIPQDQLNLQQGLNTLANPNYNHQGGPTNTKQVTETQAGQAQFALNWIMHSLPTNQLTYLRAIAAKQGEEDLDVGVQNILAGMINSRISSKTSVEVSWDKPDTDTGGNNPNDNSKISQAEYLLTAGPTPNRTATFGGGHNPLAPGPSLGIVSTVTIDSGIKMQNGEKLPIYSTLEEVMEKSQISSMINPNQTSIAGAGKISAKDTGKIFYSGGEIGLMELPISEEGIMDPNLITNVTNLAEILEKDTAGTYDDLWDSKGTYAHIVNNPQLNKRQQAFAIATEYLTQNITKLKTLYIPIYYSEDILKEGNFTEDQKRQIKQNSTEVTEMEKDRIQAAYKNKTNLGLGKGKLFKSYLYVPFTGDMRSIRMDATSDRRDIDRAGAAQTQQQQNVFNQHDEFNISNITPSAR